MAFPMLGVLASQAMVAIFVGQGLVGGKQRKHSENIGIEGGSMLSFGLALVVFFKLAGLAWYVSGIAFCQGILSDLQGWCSNWGAQAVIPLVLIASFLCRFG